MLAEFSAGEARDNWSRNSAFDLMAIVLVTMCALFVFSKNLYIDNAVVFHDEYVYKVSADKQLDPVAVDSRQLAPQVPNRLFLTTYGFGSYFGSNYYIVAQLFNVLLWSIGLLILYRVALLTGLSKARSLAFLGAAALLPLSAYTKYFMPESMFFAMFCASLYALATGIQKQSNIAIVIAGLIVGYMYFVKPHALALVVANALFLTFVRGGVRLNVLFGAGVLLAIMTGKYALPMPVDGSAAGLGVYVQIFDTLVSKFTAYNGQWTDLIRDIFRVLAGHTLFLMLAFGLSFFIAIAVLVPQLKFRDNTADISDELKLTSFYLIATSVVFVGMAVVFTVLAGEFGRIHSRYYFFLYPIALLALFHFPFLRLTPAGKIFGLVIVTVTAALMTLFAHGYSEILSVSLVSDSPEWGFVFISKEVFIVAMLSFAIAGVLAVLRPNKFGFLVAVICVTSLLSSIDVAIKQKSIFRGAFVTGREAVAVEEIVGRDQMYWAVVVGEDRDAVSKFLFHLTTTPNVEELPSGSNLDLVVARHPLATRIILLSDTYQVSPHLKCGAEPSRVRVCNIVK